MEVKAGYKQTEVGVFPEEWDVRSCSELSERIMVGIVIRPTQYYVLQGVPAFRSANIREDGITDFDLVFISEDSNNLLAKSQTRIGDILTVRTGYPGTSAVVRSKHAGCNCIDILITRPSKKIDSDYLAIWINSSFGKEQVLRNQGGLAQKHFNVSDMRELMVALPSFPEQRSIATVLSDMDALLGTLDQLIAKKRDLKQATMQQLLTGKKRLPGFGKGKGYKQTEIGIIPEDWDVKTLGELTEYIKGFAFKSSDFQAHGIRVIRVSDTTFDLIKSESKIFIDEKKSKNFRKWAMKEGDLIISTVGSKPPMYDSMVGKATFVDAKNENSLLNQNAVIIRSNNWSQEAQVFLHNHLKQPRYIDHIEKIFRGNANQASITLKELFDFLIPTPKDREEQTEIATVLSDMDTEITAMEQRRDKNRDLKQGMMQELLTGRTRLL